MGIQKKSAAGRAAANTIIIYTQRFFAAALSLITTPIILNGLGVQNFGLYTLTIGFVGMLSFLNWSLSSATQRYIAYAIGEGDLPKLKKIFSTSFFIHGIYALLMLIILTIIALFFVNDLLNIPIGKEHDAKYVLLIVAFLTFINIVTIPFLGVLRANENFLAIAVTGITESVLKLLIAFSILFIDNNKLIFYSFFLLVVAMIVFGIYFFIIHSKYKQIAVSFKHVQRSFIKEMLSFISWSLLGALSIMSRNQGVQVLLNLFFGVVKNAAYGISQQVSVAMSILSQGIIGSISPQIIKSAGAGDTARMVFLMRTMSKFAIFSISIVAIPVFFQCEQILKVWLRNVPEDTVTYVRLIIIFGQIMLLSAGIQTVFDALGKVKLYNIWVSLILILNLPISYVFFKLGFPSYSIIVVGMILEFVSLNVRLQLLRKYISFSVAVFYADTVFKVILPTVIVSAIVYLFSFVQMNVYVKIALSFLIVFSIYPLIIYKWSLEKMQKETIAAIIAKVLKRR